MNRMVLLLTWFAVSLFTGAWAAGQQGPRPIDTSRSTLLVRAYKSGLFSIFAHDHEVNAPIASGTIDASGSRSVELKVDARRMEVLDPKLGADKRAEVRQTMHSDKVLDTARFPEISFRSTQVEQAGGDKYRVSGELSLHGVTRPVVVSVQEKNGRYIGVAEVKQSEFGISPIRLAGGTVNVKDVVQIVFDIAVSEQ